MNPVDATGALAREVISDRAERGRRSRLAAIASCCHPRAWHRAVGSVLGAARALVHHRRSLATVCCG
jgi:hypothetical protein